ncbi:MAG: COX15/CtaA family protein [Pseudomonadota bacterium]
MNSIEAGTHSREHTAERTVKPVALWLFFMCALVAVMVLVGGATRLTDSGLSITEWRPVTGAVPPLSDAAWREEFEKYKTIPEYSEVNFGMSLDQFKVIYWWEWAHRFLGRLIGLAFLFPLIYFAATGRVKGRLAWKLGGLFFLGGLQGALGWWMVSSGLADRVDVSQYRLAAHLGLAVLLFSLMFWLALDLLQGRRKFKSHRLFAMSVWLAGAVYAQIILGAFVAGLRAGATFNTWPLMNGKLIPDGYFAGAPGVNDLFETMAAVQFNHRTGAYLVAAFAVWFWFKARGTMLEDRAGYVLGAVGIQIIIGVFTVVSGVPIGLGLLHQAGALALLATAIYAAHGARYAEVSKSGTG